MNYYTAEKQGAPTLCNSSDRSGEHYAKWNKPGGERQIPYDLTYKRNNQQNKQTNMQNITRDIEIKNKMRVTRGKVGGDNGGKDCQGTYIKDIWTKPNGGRIEGGRWG